MAKLKRSAMLTYLNATPNDEIETWFVIGKHVEDMSVELNPDTTPIKNIFDETSVNDNGYEPSVSVDTYYADPEDGAFYEWIKNIAMNRLTGDDCKTQILEVLVDKTEGSYDAWREDAVVKPQSYGGAQGGISIPYNITFCGNRTKGTATLAKGRAPTFTEANE